MATDRLPRLRRFACFIGRGLALGVAGSYLAAFIFLNLIYVLLIGALAFDVATGRNDSAELALLPYAVPAALVIAGLAGHRWARAAGSRYRWRRIAVAIWIGLIIGGFPVPILLALAMAYALVIGFVPGLLAGLIWTFALAGLALAQRNPRAYERSARRVSAALMAALGPVALTLGSTPLFGWSVFDESLRELVSADVPREIAIFYIAIGLSSAAAAWLLTPLLTRWYVREGASFTTPGNPPETPLNSEPATSGSVGF